jgi:hypothetical protein
MHKVRNKEREFTMTNFHVEAKVRNNLYFAPTEFCRIMMVIIIHVRMLESLLKMAKLGRNMLVNVKFQVGETGYTGWNLNFIVF